MVQDETGKRTIQAFVDTAGQVRTSLLDTALGLDYILPGVRFSSRQHKATTATSGARLGQWLTCTAAFSHRHLWLHSADVEHDKLGSLVPDLGLLKQRDWQPVLGGNLCIYGWKTFSL